MGSGHGNAIGVRSSLGLICCMVCGYAPWSVLIVVEFPWSWSVVMDFPWSWSVVMEFPWVGNSCRCGSWSCVCLESRGWCLWLWGSDRADLWFQSRAASLTSTSGDEKVHWKSGNHLFFIEPSYGELYCGSFDVLQSKFWRLIPKLFMDYILRNN